MLLYPIHLGYVYISHKPPNGIDDVQHKGFRRGRASSQPDDLPAGQPCGIHFGSVGNEMTGYTLLNADFPQAIRIGAVLRTDNKNEVRNLAEVTNRRLTILGGITNVGSLRAHDIGKTSVQGGNDTPRIVNTQSGLSDVSHWGVSRELKPIHVLLRRDQVHLGPHLPHRPLDLGMAAMADENQGATVGNVSLCLGMHLRNQRAGCINHRQPTRFCLADHGLRNAMGAEYCQRAIGNLTQFLDEAGSLFLKVADDMLIVDDFMAHIDGLAGLLQRLLDNLDSAHHTGAKAARLSKYDSHYLFMSLANYGPDL